MRRHSLVLYFELSNTQDEKLKAWQKTHSCKYSKLRFERYIGIFGGADTFLFMPSSVGSVIVQIQCACGAELDLTDGTILNKIKRAKTPEAAISGVFSVIRLMDAGDFQRIGIYDGELSVFFKGHYDGLARTVRGSVPHGDDKGAAGDHVLVPLTKAVRRIGTLEYGFRVALTGDVVVVLPLFRCLAGGLIFMEHGALRRDVGIFPLQFQHSLSRDQIGADAIKIAKYALDN